MIRLLFPSLLRALVAVVVVVLVVGCSEDRGTTFSDGYTRQELLDGVLADPADFELEVSECVATSEHSVDESVSYNVYITVTNADDRQRTFEVWIFRDGEEWDRRPLVWLEPGESGDIRGFLGWEDEIVGGCPEYRVEVYRNPVEALFGEEV
jgi:hypothetical protein